MINLVVERGRRRIYQISLDSNTPLADVPKAFANNWLTLVEGAALDGYTVRAIKTVPRINPPVFLALAEQTGRIG